MWSWLPRCRRAAAIRISFVLATPNYALVHDALDYQRHAVSLADGNGFALSYGRPTAFRSTADEHPTSAEGDRVAVRTRRG